jgi:hypothetical protein
VGRETLAVVAEKWWKTYVVPNLALKTKRIGDRLLTMEVLGR